MNVQMNISTNHSKRSITHRFMNTQMNISTNHSKRSITHRVMNMQMNKHICQSQHKVMKMQMNTSTNHSMRSITHRVMNMQMNISTNPSTKSIPRSHREYTNEQIHESESKKTRHAQLNWLVAKTVKVNSKYMLYTRWVKNATKPKSISANLTSSHFLQFMRA